MNNSNGSNLSSYSSTACASCNSAVNSVNVFLLNFSLYWVIGIAPCAIVLNLIALVTFARVKELLPATTRMLMIHQAYIEICSSSLGVVQQVTRHVSLYFPPTPVGLGLCITYNAAYWAFDASLQLNCVLITIDRYFAVCHVMKRYLNKRRTIGLIILVQVIGWLELYSQGIAIQRVDPDTGACQFLNDVNLTRPWGVLYFLFEIAPIICVLFIYPRMIFVLIKSSRQMSDSSNTGNSNTKSIATKRLIRTGLIAAVVLIIANMPDTVFFSLMYAILGDNPNYLNSWEQTIDFAFKSLYPLMCPIIYSFSTPKFRSAVPIAFGINK